MIVRVHALFRPFIFPIVPRPASRSRSRRKTARAAMASGLAAFAILTIGMTASLETVAPEWRDPEFARRLDQLRGWKAKAPDRPLVVAFGSSRTQMALSPTAMGFPNQPGSPVVYNFGYRAGHPLGAWLQFSRVLDAGVKPDAVLIQLSAPELMVIGPAERQYKMWGPRFSIDDLRRLSPFTRNPNAFRRAWIESRLNLWNTYRDAIRSDLLPNWQTHVQRLNFCWETMDEYGFAPHPQSSVSSDARTRLMAETQRKYRRAFAGLVMGETTEPVLQDWIGRCRTEGIAVAFFWAPESLDIRNWYSPAARVEAAEFSRKLGTEMGASVFPSPEHLEETDFADGYHLLRYGAVKYSRWLADTHLKPWLADLAPREGGGP